ncbi:lipoyl(octanoyl) transferase LipB [Alkalinema sp. FACHB-956]|uniref:lipoyl(octanoyl) transferase LipB n=1 Tax=Alkalinema sp. FACHB-956 TaxID=2692768 RepID=UPI001685254C|nr:lipoyl(octanoyl) transferase LipB [Alkalinema sp. FACHB-956]MBD2328242.1 lipoyl(octanoyl) transferase LipB [Alkalinema sp. FACHB-956]
MAGLRESATIEIPELTIAQTNAIARLVVYSALFKLETLYLVVLEKNLAENRRSCRLYQPGLVPYAEAWAWQQQQVRDRKAQIDAGLDPADSLMLLEHPPVYTLGQGSDTGFLKFDPQTAEYELHRIERGGEVTYHCPGQLVGYPILNLQHYRKDLHWYLRQLEEVIIQVLGEYGLQGDRVPGLTGVWVEGAKVAAIGIKVSRWITMHGFALNVCPDLSGFSQIVPCGIADKPVGRMTDWLPGLTVEQVLPIVVQKFAEVFEVSFSSH